MVVYVRVCALYTCACVYVCVSVRARTCVCIVYLCVRVCVCARMCVFVPVLVCACAYVSMHAHVKGRRPSSCCPSSPREGQPPCCLCLKPLRKPTWFLFFAAASHSACTALSPACSACRVGQNHIYTMYVRYFWQGNHRIYGHIRCIYTVLANPICVPFLPPSAAFFSLAVRRLE
jgi:hypothetical protein